MADQDSSSENPTNASTTPSADSDNESDPTSLPPLKKTYLLQWMEITVSEPEKRTSPSMKMQDAYIVYLLETRVTDPEMKGYGDSTTSVWRRYSEFELFRNYLEVMFPFIVIPPLPEKKPSYLWQNAPTDKFDAEFIERRRAALEIFLLRVAAHPALCEDEIFLSFLRQESGWKDLVCASDFQSKADSRLKSFSAAYRLKKPDRQFEELKNYSNELQSNISNILKVRAKLADRQYGIHKIHANYARVFSEWSSIEKDIAEMLKSAGHYMDVFSSSIDGILEEEEQHADQLKEYAAFADSVRAVCRKYECIQYDLEKTEDSLSYKANQKEMLSQGKSSSRFSLSSVKTKIFGSDTPEQREQKLKQLEEQLEEAEAELRLVNEEAKKFVELALKDIDRFKRQKVKDLKEIFTNYAIMQIKQCKKQPKRLFKRGQGQSCTVGFFCRHGVAMPHTRKISCSKHPKKSVSGRGQVSAYDRNMDEDVKFLSPPNTQPKKSHTIRLESLESDTTSLLLEPLKDGGSLYLFMISTRPPQ